MREREYGVGGCKYRYTETRTGIGRHKALRTTVLTRRCDKRNNRYLDKKCIYPKMTHKDCLLV